MRYGIIHRKRMMYCVKERNPSFDAILENLPGKVGIDYEPVAGEFVVVN